MDVKIKVLSNDIPVPGYAYPGDAGLDLRSTIDVEIKPFQRILIPVGFAIEIPDGYAGFVLPRSGQAYKQGLSMANTPGLIDSHYRGEVKVCAINLDPIIPIHIKKGERIAQLVIMQTPFINISTVDTLSDTNRGEGGFGSSGV